MKKKLFKSGLTAAIAALSLGIGGTAVAGCVELGSCFDNFQALSVEGSASFGGFGAGVFNGEQGGIRVDKEGSAMTKLDLKVAGSACDINCSNTKFTFDATAMEKVSVIGGAIGTHSGQAVNVVNNGGAFSKADFSLGIINRTAP